MRKTVTVLVLLALTIGGCKSLLPGYRTLAAVRDAGDNTGKMLAAACKAKRLSCVEKHKADKGALAKCLDGCHKALKHWVKHVKPALNTGLLATHAGLETAYKAGKKETNWMGLLMPSACALLKSLKEWEPLLPEKAKAIAGGISGMAAWVCK